MLISFIIAAILLGHVVYQLKTGELLTRHWTIDTTRTEKPAQYWVTISVEAAAMLGIFILVVVDFFRAHN